MDSLTHIALGAGISMAAMGRRTAPWKAALWGAVAATLPDLDIFIDHGDPIRDMVLHRSETHALFWLSLFSLPFAAAIARLHGEWGAWRRWWLALWLTLMSHPLLDAMTVYGTRLGLPFTDQPVGVGSIFIIDPLYTLPLLIGTLWLLRTGGRGPAGTKGRAANLVGLALSTVYLAWGVMVQAHVRDIAQRSLAAQGIVAEHLLVTPSAFNSVLWRVVAVEGSHYHEGFRSLLDREPSMSFERFERGTSLAGVVADIDGVHRVQAFSRGFWALWEDGGRVGIVDLRVGQEPVYTFRFLVANRQRTPAPLAVAQAVGGRPELGRGLAWLARRPLGEPLPPPR